MHNELHPFILKISSKTSEHRSGLKETEDSFSDEQPSSDEDMEWRGNNLLFANLSIPQLDGTADESSGESSHPQS